MKKGKIIPGKKCNVYEINLWFPFKPKFLTGVDTMDKYVCTACGYVYDPEIGDPDSGIAPGTSFEDIPEDWVCPLCGVGKDMFEKA